MKLIKILESIVNDQDLNVIRDWVVDDYNVSKGHNPDVDTNRLLKVLEPYKRKGKIYRVVSVPKETTDVEGYIRSKITDRYASFSDNTTGIKYFMPYVTQDPNEKPIIISQTSEYYSLFGWYEENYNDLQALYEKDPDTYWWIDTNLPEVENTGEAIAKTSQEFHIFGPKTPQ